MPTTLVVSNDFPPRIGGIESFVADVCDLLEGDVVVYTSGPVGAAGTDDDRGYPVVRDGALLLPTRRLARRTASVLRHYRASRVVFGATAPLGLLAPGLRRAGAEVIVGMTHGHEIWWASLPAARPTLRRIADHLDALSTISSYTAGRIGPALSDQARTKIFRLSPPVDLELFRPADPGHWGRPRCIAVARFVEQKGIDVLLYGWRRVLDRWPGGERPELVLVGDGPQAPKLRRLADRLGVAAAVRFTGALPRAGVVVELQRARVFALPMRTRLGGLNPEGLGLAALEAAACGLPVLVGDSGGAPETVRDGVSGFVVDPHDPRALADRLLGLLRDRDRAVAMGQAGRAHVAKGFAAPAARTALREALRLD